MLGRQRRRSVRFALRDPSASRRSGHRAGLWGSAAAVSERAAARGREALRIERIGDPFRGAEPAELAGQTVIPAANRASMLASWELPPVSAKPAEGASARSKARTRNDAIRARVTVSSGQKRSGSSLQLTVILRSASRSTWGIHHSSSSTSANLDSVTGGGSPPSRARTIHTATVQRFAGSSGQNSCSPHSVPSNSPVSASPSPSPSRPVPVPVPVSLVGRALRLRGQSRLVISTVWVWPSSETTLIV